MLDECQFPLSQKVYNEKTWRNFFFEKDCDNEKLFIDIEKISWEKFGDLIVAWRTSEAVG
jgi:hypothetical protein